MQVALDVRTQPPILIIKPQSETEVHSLRAAGACWIRERQTYATTHLDVLERVAANLRQNIPPELIGRLRAAYAKIEAWSEAADAALVEPGLQMKFLDLYPFQRAGAACLLGRRSVLLADEMGLGKTAQVAVALRVLAGRPGCRFLVICPASLKRWWADEIEKWSGIQDIEVLAGKKCETCPPARTVWIVNYDIVSAYEEWLTEIQWDACILDEAHLVKNPKAARTQVICGDRKHRGIRARHRVALTGTPILNYPAEMFQILRWLDPIGWPRQRSFQLRYCAGHIDRFGCWNTKGSSNLEELNLRLRRTVMIRRMKADVLQALPEKSRQVILVDPDEHTAKAIGRQAEWMRRLGISASEDPGAVYEKLTADRAAFEEISRLRRELAESKVSVVADYLEDALKQKEKVVCFAHHRVLIDALAERFKKIAVRFAGDTPAGERDEAVRRFQTDPGCKLFVGSIGAAGTGITLTASDLCVFAELDWVPANMLQAEARLHRIGQKGNVLVQYLIVNESLDAKVIYALTEKIHVIERTLGKAVV